MQISDVDDFGLRVYNTVKRHRILPVDISLSSGSLLVTVGKDAQQPPYRIENRFVTDLPTAACNSVALLLVLPTTVPTAVSTSKSTL